MIRSSVYSTSLISGLLTLFCSSLALSEKVHATDQAKKEVQIKYDERNGRPAQITRPKVGTIAITYKPNGEINKVESNDGAAVATQIASTFNNLLDIVAPATAEMNL